MGNGRSRARSSASRTAGMMPVARLGRSVFTVRSQSASCCSRSARSWKRRHVKKLFLTQPTRFSTAPFCWPARGQHSSGAKRSSSATCPNTGFQTISSPLRARTTVLGLSQTVTSGTPRKASKAWSSPRISASSRSSGTSVTSTKRLHFSRLAKKRTRSTTPVDEANAHHAEVVLAEFTRDALEADERGDGHGAEPSDQLVQCALAAPVAVVLAQASDDLATGQGPLVVQPPLDRRGPGRGQRRA